MWENNDNNINWSSPSLLELNIQIDQSSLNENHLNNESLVDTAPKTGPQSESLTQFSYPSGNYPNAPPEMTPLMPYLNEFHYFDPNNSSSQSISYQSSSSVYGFEGSRDVLNGPNLSEFTTSVCVSNASKPAKRGRGRGSRGSYKTRSGPRQNKHRQPNRLNFPFEPDSCHYPFNAGSLPTNIPPCYHSSLQVNSGYTPHHNQTNFAPCSVYSPNSGPSMSNSNGNPTVCINPEILRRLGYQVQGPSNTCKVNNDLNLSSGDHVNISSSPHLDTNPFAPFVNETNNVKSSEYSINQAAGVLSEEPQEPFRLDFDDIDTSKISDDSLMFLGSYSAAI